MNITSTLHRIMLIENPIGGSCYEAIKALKNICDKNLTIDFERENVIHISGYADLKFPNEEQITEALKNSVLKRERKEAAKKEKVLSYQVPSINPPVIEASKQLRKVVLEYIQEFNDHKDDKDWDIAASKMEDISSLIEIYNVVNIEKPDLHKVTLMVNELDTIVREDIPLTIRAWKWQF